MMETALTVEEVARMLKVSPRTIRKLATRGEIPGRKIGNRWRFSSKAVQQWLATGNGSAGQNGKILQINDGRVRRTGNPHLDFYGALASNPLAQEVADYIQAEKERQRQEAIEV